ncbi:RHS repeat protein [Streptomyces sp. NBC_01218]|uniref:RHS repeat domain-containing protein n=1 Tax=Streptomyces sp. NBC_01218 TaxID=2903780 RepID=UPI002E13E94B|nr:RHS repeat protein [Streptomyces sp. NBC_01218]
MTDRNGGVIAVPSHGAGAGAGAKITETRSGRWVDVTNDVGGWWHATDHTGRQVSYHLDDQDRVVKVTDTNMAIARFGYASSGRVVSVATPENRVIRFGYDTQNRVTSMRLPSITATLQGSSA